MFANLFFGILFVLVCRQFTIPLNSRPLAQFSFRFLLTFGFSIGELILWAHVGQLLLILWFFCCPTYPLGSFWPTDLLGSYWPTHTLISCCQINPISYSCPTNVQCVLFAADFQISTTYIDFVPTLTHLVSPFQILKPSPFPNSTSSLHQGLQDSWEIYIYLKSTQLLKETLKFKYFFGTKLHQLIILRNLSKMGDMRPKKFKNKLNYKLCGEKNRK